MSDYQKAKLALAILMLVIVSLGGLSIWLLNTH